MNCKSFFSLVFLAVLCMGLFTIHVSAMQIPIKDELDKVCIGCNRFGKQIKKLSCEHPLCASCYEEHIEEMYQRDWTSYCPSCNAVIRVGTDIEGKQLITLVETPLHSSLKKLENSALYVGAYVGARGLIWGLGNPLFPNTQIQYGMGFAVSMTGLLTCLKSRVISKGIREAQLMQSIILEKRIIAFKKEYNQRALLAALLPVGSMGLLYAASHVKGYEAVITPNRILNFGLASSALSNFLLEVWGVKYPHIPRIK